MITPERLAEIEARAEAYPKLYSGCNSVLASDTLDLVAEVRRLRGIIDQMQGIIDSFGDTNNALLFAEENLTRIREAAEPIINGPLPLSDAKQGDMVIVKRGSGKGGTGQIFETDYGENIRALAEAIKEVR